MAVEEGEDVVVAVEEGVVAEGEGEDVVAGWTTVDRVDSNHGFCTVHRVRMRRVSTPDK